MTFSRPLRAALGAALLAAAAAAPAHVSVEPAAALAASSLKLTLRINHGCAGAATTLVRVFVPASLRGARPIPKPGWTLEAPKQPLAQPYESHGRRVAEDVREITWRGGELPDAWADEFAFVAQLPAAAGPVAIRVLQQCGDKVLDWAETAVPGAPAPKSPAPVLDVLPGDGSGHHH